jgi:hypothetical protein
VQDRQSEREFQLPAGGDLHRPAHLVEAGRADDDQVVARLSHSQCEGSLVAGARSGGDTLLGRGQLHVGVANHIAGRIAHDACRHLGRSRRLELQGQGDHEDR